MHIFTKVITKNLYMKIFLMFILVCGQMFAYGQTTTTMSELGKIGNLRFSLVKSDTSNSISVSQNGNIIKYVVVPEDEIAEVVRALNAFAVEVENKPPEQKQITYRTKSLLLNCGYFKYTGWLISIQNPDPALEQESEKIQSRSGIQVYNFVEIKPSQIPGVVKMFLKALPAKGV